MTDTPKNFQSTSSRIHVVAAIIWHPHLPQTFLISRRPKGKHLQFYWELPGGKKESGESRTQALHRELIEEVNLQTITSSPFMQVTHEYSDRQILLDVWEVTEFEGDVIGREGQEIRWVLIDELNDFLFPDADIPILNAIKNNARA